MCVKFDLINFHHTNWIELSLHGNYELRLGWVYMETTRIGLRFHINPQIGLGLHKLNWVYMDPQDGWVSM